MVESTPSECVACGEKDADKCCKACRTVYCSKKCQVDNWPAHKRICKDLQLEKVLERTADIIKQAYLKFRENTWDAHVFKIEVKKNELVTYDYVPKHAPLFPPFPDHLITDDDVKAAVLCYLTCTEPFVNMEALFTQLLQGRFTQALCRRCRANHRRLRFKRRRTHCQAKDRPPQDDRSLHDERHERYQLAKLPSRCLAPHLN